MAFEEKNEIINKVVSDVYSKQDIQADDITKEAVLLIFSETKILDDD